MDSQNYNCSRCILWAFNLVFHNKIRTQTTSECHWRQARNSQYSTKTHS